MSTKIISHRGARGLALENTLAGIHAAIKEGADAIEFDVRATLDQTLVLCHDASLLRVCGVNLNIADTEHKVLQKVLLPNGERIPTLVDVLNITSGVIPVIIEIKSRGCVEPLIKILDAFPDADVHTASFRLNELHKLKRLRPSIFAYGISSTNPLEMLQNAKLMKFDGIGINFWLLNPFIYALATITKKELYVYTVNRPAIARMIARFYPSVWICTDFPLKIRNTLSGTQDS